MSFPDGVDPLIYAANIVSRLEPDASWRAAYHREFGIYPPTIEARESSGARPDLA